MKIYENSCRVCLVNIEFKDEDDKWISIEEKDSDDLEICEKIFICTGIIIDRKSLLAKGICEPCTEHLRSAFDFQKACKQSDGIIKDYIKNNPLKKGNDIKLEKTESNLFSTEESLPFYPEVKVELNCSPDPDENNEYKNENSSIYNIGDEIYKLKNIQKKKSARKKINIIDKSKTILAKQKRRRNNRLISSNNDTEEENMENCRVYDLEEEIIEDSKKGKFKNLKKEEKESFICELCGNVYKKRALLSDHMRWHSGEKEFQCEICKKSFLLATYLARHMKTHTGIRNFQCNFCSRTFYTNGLKRAHEKVHTGERQYLCKLCNRSFSYSQSLQRHMMVHSGVKPFKCKECGKEFRQETHLKQHLSTNIHQAKTAAALQIT